MFLLARLMISQSTVVEKGKKSNIFLITRILAICPSKMAYTVLLVVIAKRYFDQD
jgi:hypothetical protein